MDTNDSNNTGGNSGTGAVPPSGSSSSPPAHWVVQLLNRLAAFGLATPVALKLPDWIVDESKSLTVKALAIGYVLAVAFPQVLKDVATLIEKAKGVGK
jgi:hypothetical protein